MSQVPLTGCMMGVEVQDIFAAHFDGYAAKHRISLTQWKAAQNIMSCRTAKLGAHVDVCDKCGYTRISYNSCRDRHCPKCQTYAKELWLDGQRRDLLNTHYFHVVFTVPEELNSLLLHGPKEMYALLFKAASETVMELCADQKYLGAVPGITAVLHTWGQNLCFHPHIHMIVSGGGLTALGKWVSSRKKFFLPVRVLSAKFRGKFMALLQARRSLSRGLLDVCYSKNWVVYCKPPFGSAEKVLDYLGRYTHRVAISNNRILSLEDGKVTFRWRDYSDGNKVKRMTLDAEEFIRRYLLHVLPKEFRKLRHYGLYAPRNKQERLKLCRRLTGTPAPEAAMPVVERLRNLLGKDFDLCPCCKIGHLSREPPAGRTA